MSKQDKMIKKQERDNFLYLLKHTKIPWALFLVNMAISMGLSIVYVFLPEVTGEIMAGNIMDPSIIMLYAISTIGATLLGIGISIFELYVQFKTDTNIRKSVWNKIMCLPLKVWGGAEESQISRVTNDPENMSYMLSYCFSLIVTTVTLAGILINVFTMDIRLFLLMLIVIPWTILASLPANKMEKIQRNIQESLSDYTEFITEKLERLPMIKAAGEEEKEDGINEGIAKQQMNAEIKMAKWDMIAQPITYSLEAGVKAIALIYGGYLLSRHIIEADDAVTLFIYSGQISVNVMQYIFCYQYIKKSKGATQRIAEILRMEDEKLEREMSFAFPDDTITFSNVSFTYPDGREALQNINCHIPSGKHTMLVGNSGAGKTTLLRLLERLYEPTEGTISIGEADASRIHLNEWRDSFSAIPQNSALMDGSFIENILYGVNTDVSEERLDEVISMVNLKDIAALAKQDTNMRDISDKLSGGERQRIALARMMIRDPEYMILDEATANLDVANTAIVKKAIDRMKSGRTVIEVTHNVADARDVDHIIFMKNGSVAAEGTHEELYTNNNDYRTLFDASLTPEVA